MVQEDDSMVKSLLHKHEDLSSGPGTHVKSPALQWTPVIPALGRQWGCSLDWWPAMKQLYALDSVLDWVSQNKMENN